MRYQRDIRHLMIRRRLHLPGAIHIPSFLSDIVFYGVSALALVLGFPFALLAAFNVNLVTAFFVVSPHMLVEPDGLLALIGAWFGLALCAGLVAHSVKRQAMLWGILLPITVTILLVVLYARAAIATVARTCTQPSVPIAERISCHREKG